MKTAIVFYGFFRHFNACKHTLKKYVLDPLNADVFFNCPEYYFAPQKDEHQWFHERFSKHENKLDQSVLDFFGDKLKFYDLSPRKPPCLSWWMNWRTI